MSNPVLNVLGERIKLLDRDINKLHNKVDILNRQAFDTQVEIMQKEEELELLLAHARAVARAEKEAANGRP